MIAYPLRRWIRAVGTAAALVTAAAVPLGYGLVSYSDEARTLEFKARLNAGRVSKHILAHGEKWVDRARLAELIDFTEAKEDQVRQRIYDANGRLVLDEGAIFSAPTFFRAAPIFVGDRVAGRIEVEASALPLLDRIAAAAGAGLLLGILIFCALRWLPLRLLDQTVGTLQQRERELATQNIRFEAALENMPHALCMFDGDYNLVICNKNFLRMYRLAAEEMQPGTPLRTVLERRIAAGTCPHDSTKFSESKMKFAIVNKPLIAVDRLRDGRFVSVIRKPIAGGGWVSIHLDITEQKRVEEKITHMAHHDSLTNLPNRVFLRDQLNQHLSRVKRGATIAILCLDLDFFKQVNDTLGHSVGDALLCAVAQRLRECVREVDVVSRLGGDEFAIVQVDDKQPAGATALAERLVSEMARPFEAEGHEIIVGTSVGISVAPHDCVDADQLLKNADMALYRAKDHGRNGFCFFEPGMDVRAHERRALEIDLRKAIAAGQFELFYQPVVNLERNTITSFEALLRWHHPTRGLVSPATFIPLAEETGLIIPLGEWVLRQACAEAAKWPDQIRLAVNLSPVQFRSKNLVATIMSAIAAAEIAAGRVELEITEAVLLHNSETVVAVLHQLRALGVNVSIDDFGTGYSSLSYLRTFPFDKIKIDRSFVRGIEHDQDAIAIVRAVSSLGKDLGIATTAEGVETQEQLDQVRAEGCTEVQGFLFSKPQPASELPRLLSMLGKASQAAA